MSETIWTSIFEKDGNEFFFPYEDFCAEDKLEATQIAFGASLVEGIIYDMEFVEAREIDPTLCLNTKAKLGMNEICVISGPMFDKAIDEDPEILERYNQMKSEREEDHA